MKQLLELFVKRATVENYSVQTIKSYKNYISKFQDYCRGNLDQEKINDFLYYLKNNKKYSVSSILSARYALIYIFYQDNKRAY